MTSARYRLVLRAETEDDLREAAAWYEAQRPRPGLGREFLHEFRAAADKLRHGPLRFQVAFAQIRRIFLRRFPYALFYEVVGHEVIVLACFHTSRDPEHLQQRIPRH